MEDLRNRIRSIVLGIVGFITALLLIRLVLGIFGVAPSANPIVQIIYGITDPLVRPLFDFTYDFGNFDLNTFLAIVVYIVIALLLVVFITSLLQESLREVVISVIDTFFKLIEFFLILRLVLRLFGISGNAGAFADLVLGSTTWATGVFPSVTFGGGVLEFSTLAVLIIVVVIDLATEGLIASLLPKAEKKEE